MKKIILAILLALSSTAFATSADSVRGSFGFVNLNDSHSKMIDVLGDPKSSYKHVIHDRKHAPGYCGWVWLIDAICEHLWHCEYAVHKRA